MIPEDFTRGEEIKLETNNGYYYKGRVKKINEDSILIRDIRGIKTLIYLKDIDWVRVLPKGNKNKRVIFDKQKYEENINKDSIRIHDDKFALHEVKEMEVKDGKN